MHKKLTADYIERGRQLEESGLSGVIAKAKKNGQNNIPQLKPALCVFDAAPAPKPALQPAPKGGSTGRR